MLYLHAILLILTVIILPIRICDGSSLFHPVSYRKTHNISNNNVSINKRRVKKNVAFMVVNVVPRGGADIDYFDSDNEEEVIDSSEYDDTDTTVASSIDPILDLPLGLEPSKFSFLSNIHIMHYAHVLIRVTKRACRAGVRAVMMNENDISDDVEDDNEKDNSRPVVNTILGRGAYVVGQMYHAALTPPEDDYDDELGIAKDEEGTHKRRRKRKKQRTNDQPHRNRRSKNRRKKQMYTSSPTAIPSCGGIEEDEGPQSHDADILQLAKQYNINNLSNPLSKRYSSILLSSQITLNEALQKANADARFLICYISKGGPNNTNNALIMPHLLSSEVVKMINRKPLGKKQTGDTSAYYIWITNDDKDVELAMKRLKVKPPTSRNNSSSKKKKKSKKSSTAPILTIVYPSMAIDSSGGKLTISPKMLTQHHCHPPPSTSTTLISWMNTIRKRHLREYNKLQHDRKEFQLLKERTEGYIESQQQDKAREEKDEIEKQKKREEEEKEKARLQQILNRREELLENLVEEPNMGEDGVITIALRFTAGANNKRDMSTCKRRFDASTTTTNDVFNWIDAVHEIEREKVELSTMNGAKKFIYDEDGGEKTLESAGLGKMTALRVSEVVVGDDAKEDETGEEEEESGEEDESEEYDDESGEYDSDEE